MSLVGNLEDLGLGEILQIVSLSRKSGVLQLNSRSREGRVIFQDGQVIRATATTFPENIGDLVLRTGLADLETFKKVLAIQQRSKDGRRIGDILVSDFGVERDAIETAVRKQVERIVYSFFSWDEGSFSFELGEPSELATTNLNPMQFMLDQGLNPQWLAMEGSRILDERRHRGEDVEDQGESLVDVDQLLAEVKGEDRRNNQASLTPSENLQEAGRRKFLVVDDDPNTAEQIATLLQKRKFQVHVFTHFGSFMEAISHEDPRTTTLVIDLIMPRRDGSGMLGGLELLGEVRRRYPEFQVLMISDHPNQEAERSIRKYGVQTLLPKPKKADISDSRGREALAAMVDALISVCKEPAASAATEEQLYNIGAELLREIGEVSSGDSPQGPQQTPGLHILRGMLQELNNPSLGGGIILLILRFASELMNRAVILLVKENEIVGLGQFGIELAGESADIRVRNTKLPKSAEHVFAEALKTFTPCCLQPQQTEWNDYLFKHLGGKRPKEVFVGPLISEGRVVAVLYGDNLPEEKPIGDTESLEIFLSQAGLAMEKALLERRMTSKRNLI
jgi:DNA-binding NarL/FixJ family response regulator